MSIFDSMSPEQIAGLLSMDNGDLDLTLFGQSAKPSLWQLPSNQELMMDKKKKEIKKPEMGKAMRDVSGFANYGMTPPKLPVGQGMLPMPGVQNASQPSQARAPVRDPGIAPMPKPGLMNTPNSSGPGLMGMPSPAPNMMTVPGGPKGPGPGSAGSSNPGGPGLMSMPNRNPAPRIQPGRSEPNPIPDSMNQIMSLMKMLRG